MDDVARAFDAITHKGSLGERYNIGTNVDRTVLEVVQTIAQELHVGEDRIKHVEDRIFNDQRYYMDSNKLIALGWREEVEWMQGLRDTIRWYKNHRGYWSNIATALLPHPTVPAETDVAIPQVEGKASGDEPHNGHKKAKR